jgi:hypothetical protein
MGKTDTKDLLQFLSPFGPEKTALVMWLRDFAWKLCPKANELIYDNYNAVAFGWSPTDRVGHTICSIAVGRTTGNVHFGFYWGSALKDDEKVLLGKGNQYRYILVTDRKSFPKPYMKKLVHEAYAVSLSKVKDKEQLVRGLTIVKSISEKKQSGKARKSP